MMVQIYDDEKSQNKNGRPASSHDPKQLKII